MSTILQFFFRGTLFIAFFCVTDTGLTMGVPISFIVCHAEAPFLCKQVSCCCRNSFAGRQTSCTCTSSAYSIRLTGTDAFLISRGTRSSPSFVQEHNPTWIVWLITGSVATKYFCFQPQSNRYHDELQLLPLGITNRKELLKKI